MSQNSKAPEDAFKALMAAARTETGRPKLAHQSRGRPLSEAEDTLADALMALYGEGISGEAALAEGLTARGVPRPSTGATQWTGESLAQELHRLNAEFDAAYLEHGYGA